MGAISTWEPDTVEALLDLHDVDGGTVVFSARPDTSSPRRGLCDLLAAMGKEVSGHLAPSETALLAELCVSWLIAERIHTVAVVAVERWPARVVETVRSAVEASGATFIEASTRSADGVHLAHAQLLEAGHVHGPGRVAAAPAGLRAFRFPHFAAAGLLYRLTADWSVFDRLTVCDVDAERQSVRIAGGTLVVPAASWRFLRVQEVHSRRAGKRALFTRFGQQLRRDEIVFGILKTTAVEDDRM
jgi:hypothetical protein